VPAVSGGILHLRQAGVSVVVDPGDSVDASTLPQLLHWGADLGELTDAQLADLRLASTPPLAHNPNDQVWGASILPDLESGWVGRPGLEGSRDGRDWSPAFRVTDLTVDRSAIAEDGRTADILRAVARDAAAGLQLMLDLQLLSTGLLRSRATLTNIGDDPFTVDAVRIAYRVPAEADELLDFTGRHLTERVPQRSSFPVGVHSRLARGGRTGLDAAFLLIAGRAGFGFRSGELWGTHVAFSGNQEIYAERSYNGARVLGGGELLLAGEIRLAQDETYASPWFYGAYAEGLDAMSARFHRHLRERADYPRLPRPVIANTWEAVYFGQSLEALSELADVAARAGVERFVLDDGWFGSRRDDTSGLGDWTVSTDVWPDGLHPLIRHVHSLGMDFGLWVEPEMVNLDSDLAREHPEWIFRTGGRLGAPSRNQYGLDLGHPGAFAHIRGALLALLDEYDIAYLKWDHNRQLFESGHTPDGRPGTHEQTLAVYQLMGELKRAHPGLEIESCASGGGRIDLGILEHTDRVWASDTNDPLERQAIHRWTTLLVPPELIGSHIGAAVSHTTGRASSLDFRGATALFTQLGFELDLRTLGADEFARVCEWVAAHKEHRELFHTGTVVNADHPDASLVVRGVVSADRRAAIYEVATIARAASAPPGRLRLPGLDDDVTYRVSILAPSLAQSHGSRGPEWMSKGVELPGRVLEMVGLQLANAWPETAYLLSVVALPPDGPDDSAAADSAADAGEAAR
jgi:alpha-galactosidase